MSKAKNTPESTPAEKDEIDVKIDSLLTPDEFQFLDFVNHEALPEEELELYMNELAVVEIEKADLEMRMLDRLDPDFEKKAAAIARRAKKHKKALDDSKVTFYLKGVDDDLIADCKTAAEAHFEKSGKVKQYRSATGKLQGAITDTDDQLDYVKYYNALILSVHIVRIVNAKGVEMVAPTAEYISYFMDKAPSSQRDRLAYRINSLRVDAGRFENAVSADFLAKP